MEAIDYKNMLVELISIIKDKATYLKSIPDNTDISKDNFDGQAFTYYQILDSLIGYFENQDGITLEELGLDGFDPLEILDYEPKKKKPMV
jgi:hypothetical protein